MATWVDCTSASGWLHWFAADMGPYLGPWPLLPPGEIGGLNFTNGDEADFVVMLPNPADPTDITIAGDWTYSTPVWDAYRYPNDPGGPPPLTGFGYSGEFTPPGTAVPASPPAGVHLYVMVKYGSPQTPPPNPPEFYVPATYAAGGTAAFETAMGTWSAGQAAFDRSVTVRGTNGPGLVGSESADFTSDQNVGTQVDALLTTLLAATSPGPAIGGTVIGAKQAGVPNTTSVKLYGESQVNNFDGSAYINPTGTLSFPHSVLDPLIFDQDYSDTPYIGTDGHSGSAYAFDTSITFDWGTLPFGGINAHAAQTGGTLASDYTDFDIPIRVGWGSGALVPFVDPDQWTYSGTTLGDYIGVVGSGIDPSISVDMSTVPDIVFHVYWGQRFLYTGAVGATDFAMPGGEADYVRAALASGGELLPLTVHFPTWKYWVPGAIVPASGLFWHTVGGHWATAGGATMRIQTPGVGWVDVVDGPA